MSGWQRENTLVGLVENLFVAQMVHGQGRGRRLEGADFEQTEADLIVLYADL